MKRVALGLGVLCLAACGSDPAELAWPADAPGEYTVGYTSRPLQYTTEEGEQRSLRLAIWYPAVAAEGPNVSYLEAVERSSVYQGAPPNDYAIATLVWSHGSLAFAEASGFLAEHLASHGMVVLAPDHVGNTIMDIGFGTNADTYAWRPQDVSAVADWWQARDAGDPLAPLVNERFLVGGHSFGGYTSLAVTGASFSKSQADCDGGFSGNWCKDLSPEKEQRFQRGYRDERFEVSLLYNSGSGTVVDATGITVPTLMFTAGQDGQTPNSSNGDPIWAGLTEAGNVRVEDPMSGHNTLTVMCEIAPSLDPDGGCESDHTRWTDAWHWSNTYALAYARWALWGNSDSRAIIDGTPVAAGLVIDRR